MFPIESLPTVALTRQKIIPTLQDEKALVQKID